MNMPQLAPKRICADCGKDIGRKWKEYNLCSACIRKRELTDVAYKDRQKGDIPY